MEGFTFGLSDLRMRDARRATFTLHLSSPNGESIILRDCRLLAVGTPYAHVATPLHYINGEQVPLVTLPRRLRQEVAAEVVRKLAELEAGEAVR